MRDMSTLQASQSHPSDRWETHNASSVGRHPWWRVLALTILLIISIFLYGKLLGVAQPDAPSLTPFLMRWLLCFLPYGAACTLVLFTKPAGGCWRWIELGIIFGGALLLRAMLLPFPPNLSHDSWRYLWDARVTLHGYSPYVYPPEAKVLQPLRDALIYDNSRFRNVPTVYPPGAQAIYLLSYLLAPSNLPFLKGIFFVFDMATCGALAVLLAHRGLDPRRVVMYAWCPLPIVEFALQGHLDALTITFMVLAILCAGGTRRGSRMLTGFLIAMATLTKIYPLFLLLVVMRRRDWALLATCIGTIVLAYIPYLILGHGQVLGYFTTYSGEEGGNAGIVQVVTYSLFFGQGYTALAMLQQHIVDILALGLMSCLVLVMRLFKSISMEAATMVLLGVVLSVSSHVFPWYTVALLPWITVLPARVPFTGTLAGGRLAMVGKWLAVIVAWYFCCISLIGYFFNNTRDWHIYYALVYDVVLVGLGLALFIGLWGQFKHLHRLTLEGKGNGTAKHS